MKRRRHRRRLAPFAVLAAAAPPPSPSCGSVERTAAGLYLSKMARLVAGRRGGKQTLAARLPSHRCLLSRGGLAGTGWCARCSVGLCELAFCVLGRGGGGCRFSCQLSLFRCFLFLCGRKVLRSLLSCPLQACEQCSVFGRVVFSCRFVRGVLFVFLRFQFFVVVGCVQRGA